MARRDYLKQDKPSQYEVGTQLYFPPNTTRDVKRRGQNVQGRNSGHPLLYVTSWLASIMTLVGVSWFTTALIKDPINNFLTCLVIAIIVKIYLARKWRVGLI